MTPRSAQYGLWTLAALYALVAGAYYLSCGSGEDKLRAAAQPWPLLPGESRQPDPETFPYYDRPFGLGEFEMMPLPPEPEPRTNGDR